MQLQIFEVESRLACLRLRVGRGEAGEELLKQHAVARRGFVERCALHGVTRLFVGRRALAGGAEAGELHQPVGPTVTLEQCEHLRRVASLELRRRPVVGQSMRRFAQLLDTARKLGQAVDGEIEIASGRSQRLVNAGEHATQPIGAIGREQAQPIGLLLRAKLGERLLERLAAEHCSLRVVELAETRVEPGCERIALQQAQAETVDRRDPRAVELAREILSPALSECGANARAQLACRAARVRDHEDRVDVEPAVADRTYEALHEDSRLPGPRSRRDEDLAGRLYCRELLLVHERSILQIGQRSHHAGHAPPFGSCLTSPSPMRTASRCAVSFALSTAFQKASSS